MRGKACGSGSWKTAEGITGGFPAWIAAPLAPETTRFRKEGDVFGVCNMMNSVSSSGVSDKWVSKARGHYESSPERKSPT